MKKDTSYEKLFENESVIYGYFKDQNFYPYYDESCKTLNCFKEKFSDKVFLI